MKYGSGRYPYLNQEGVLKKQAPKKILKPPLNHSAAIIACLNRLLDNG